MVKYRNKILLFLALYFLLALMSIPRFTVFPNKSKIVDYNISDILPEVENKNDFYYLTDEKNNVFFFNFKKLILMNVKYENNVKKLKKYIRVEG